MIDINKKDADGRLPGKVHPSKGVCHARDPYLPEEVLWRQKEQFSDGVDMTGSTVWRRTPSSSVG